MRRQYFIAISFIILLLILIPFSGCTKTKSVFQKVLPESMTKKKRPSNPDLKKRVMVLPFIDLAGLGPEREAKITGEFLAELRKSRDLLLFGPPEGAVLPSKTKLCKLGIIKPENKLLKKAEDLGMNAIITGIVNPIQSANRKTGILFLSKSGKSYDISVVINVFDIMSKTLLLNNLESEEEWASLDKEAKNQDEKQIIDELLQKNMPSILERQASAVSKKLSNDPWTGKILAVEKNTIKITAGKDIGLRPDQHFIVFARGESISSEGGQSYNLLGDRIGEIKVTSIMEDQSLAVPVEQGPFSPGQVIRMTP
jgi:hypothetical protein